MADTADVLPGWTYRTTYTLTDLTTSQVVTTSAYSSYNHSDQLISSIDSQLGTPTYDDHGNTVTLAGNGQAITFTYDAADTNTAIEQSTNKVTYLKIASGSPVNNLHISMI